MIAIVDYRAGNLTSVLRAVRHLGHEAEITDDPAKIRAAERVIFPGVGAAGETMSNLRKLSLDRVLREDVFNAGKPLLGICIGVQVIFERSEENDAQCLGLLPGEVKKFPISDFRSPNVVNAFGNRHSAIGNYKVPQIGWNSVRFTRPHPITQGVPDKAEFYFVNSYYPAPAREEQVFGVTEYGLEFASVVASRNLVATQFHLEKSGLVGLRMLDNFCRWRV